MKDDGGEGKDWMYDSDGHADKPIKDMLRPDIIHDDPIHPDLPLGTLFSPDTLLGRMFHPETKVRHLLNPDKSPGPLLRSIQLPELSLKDDTEDILKLLHSFKTLQTGVPSVSDPILGITESPLGDATILPVLALKDLKYLIPTVANWVGMNPTNAGFQYVQEAYQSGRWFGGKPKFQLPKAYRRAGYKSLSAKAAERGPSPRKGAKEKAKDSYLASKPIENDLDSGWKHNPPSFRLTRGPDFDEFTWSTPMTDEFIQAVNQNVEEIRNGGRENVHRKLAKGLRDVGADACFRIPEYEDTTDTGSSVSGESSSSGEEERALHSGPSSASPPVVPTKRKEAPTSARDLISSKKAKSWLESL